MYEVSLAFARPASLGARGDPRRQARFGVAGKRLWATLERALGSPRQIRSKLGEGTTVELWLPRAEELGLDKPAALGALLAAALGSIC